MRVMGIFKGDIDMIMPMSVPEGDNTVAYPAEAILDGVRYKYFKVLNDKNPVYIPKQAQEKKEEIVEPSMEDLFITIQNQENIINDQMNTIRMLQESINQLKK